MTMRDIFKTHISSMCILFVSMMVVSSTAHAATITVNTTVDEYNTGGDCSLREAISAFNPTAGDGRGCQADPANYGTSDTIILPASTEPYMLTLSGAQEDDNATGDLDIDATVFIAGGGARETIIDASGFDAADRDRVIHIHENHKVWLEGVTIRGGRVPDYNGGGGGGIYNDRSDVVLLKSTVTENETQGPLYGVGGAIASIGPGGSLHIQESTLSRNTAERHGGGVFIVGHNAVMINGTLSGNVALNNGGGIARYASGTLKLYNVTITRNTGDQNADGEGHAGGIYTTNDATTITNTVIVGNSDGHSNPYADCQGVVNSSWNGGNIIGDDAGCTFIEPGPVGTENQVGAVVEAILETTLANNGGPTDTHALFVGSLAVDAGNNDACQSSTGVAGVDQRGFDRPEVGGAECDIGAFELGFCGDGFLNAATEECDDGSANSDTAADACRADCTKAGCGDVVIDAGESCDDGGESATCDEDCTEVVCGDGTVNAAAGEVCDDGNTVDGDCCAADCSQELDCEGGDGGDGGSGDGGSGGGCSLIRG